MKKIVSNVLIVSTQLIVGGLFLFMLFSNNENDKVIVVKNNNLDRMADSVSELFVANKLEKAVVDEKKEEALLAEEEARKKREEEAKKAKDEEEARKRAEEEAQRKVEEEEARRKAEEEAQRIAASVDNSVAALQGYAHNLVIYTYGWSEDDFNALVNLWNIESGWNVNCYNSYSGAFGIPQALPGDKMASEGSDYRTNGQTQIRWGLKYIQGRYGSPSGAWAHFLDKNWY